MPDAVTAGDHPGSPVGFDPARPWALDPQVALRPESFGALAYHFGTRRLSFLKSPRLVEVVRALADHPTGESAVRAAGVTESERPAVDRALDTLVATGTVRPRDAA